MRGAKLLRMLSIIPNLLVLNLRLKGLSATWQAAEAQLWPPSLRSAIFPRL
jgi:hypothetical protein